MSFHRGFSSKMRRGRPRGPNRKTRSKREMEIVGSYQARMRPGAMLALSSYEFSIVKKHAPHLLKRKGRKPSWESEIVLPLLVCVAVAFFNDNSSRFRSCVHLCNQG